VVLVLGSSHVGAGDFEDWFSGLEESFAAVRNVVLSDQLDQVLKREAGIDIAQAFKHVLDEFVRIVAERQSQKGKI